MDQNGLVLEELTDPVEIAQLQAQDARLKSNMDWLQAHWSDLMPAARGRFIAVAGQEAHIAETAAEAIQQAKAAHPDDNGIFVQFIRRELGPRIYGNRW